MGGGTAAPGFHTYWSSADWDSNSSSIERYGCPSPSKVSLEKAHDTSDATIISKIDCIMRRHTDKLLQAVDGISVRLSQLESRTHQIELSVDQVKVSVGDNLESTYGKMKQTESILLEVQSCIQHLKCKQEVMNAHALLQSKEIPFSNPAQETQTIVQTNPAQQMTQAPHQFNQQFSFASLQSSPPPPQQSVLQSIQLLAQCPPTPVPAAPEFETYFPPASQSPEVPSQQFLLPPTQQQTQAVIAPPTGIEENPFFQLNPTPVYPHQQPFASDSFPFHPTMAHHPQEARIASQSNPPSFQQFYGLNDSPSEPYSYSGSFSHYGCDPAVKYDLPHSVGTRGNNYPQIPTASAVSGGMDPAGSNNRVPIDDVVDRVALMGFPREVVRQTVRKMTENGQAVDLNEVLDKLMNDEEVQPRSRAWSGLR